VNSAEITIAKEKPVRIEDRRRKDGSLRRRRDGDDVELLAQLLRRHESAREDGSQIVGREDLEIDVVGSP
jgi:hypothetical protein